MQLQYTPQPSTHIKYVCALPQHTHTHSHSHTHARTSNNTFKVYVHRNVVCVERIMALRSVCGVLSNNNMYVYIMCVEKCIEIYLCLWQCMRVQWQRMCGVKVAERAFYVLFITQKVRGCFLYFSSLCTSGIHQQLLALQCQYLLPPLCQITE